MDINIVYESIWCITKVGTTNSKYISLFYLIRQYNFFDKIIALLSSSDEYTKHQAYWCIGYIIREDSGYKNLVSDVKVISMLEKEIQSPCSIEQLETYVWVASNICGMKRYKCVCKLEIGPLVLIHLTYFN